MKEILQTNFLVYTSSQLNYNQIFLTKSCRDVLRP